MTAVGDLQQENEELRAEIAMLRDEIERIRSASSAGFARGAIKRPPQRSWTRRPEVEDML